MDDATLRRMNRAIELWRRGSTMNSPTKDVAQGLVDKLADAGFTLQDAEVLPVSDSGSALLVRRASELEANGSVEGQIEGLRLRLQALGG